MRKNLFVVSSKTDSGLSNEILHAIREDEKNRHPPLTPERLRVVVMKEEQWIIHHHELLPNSHVLFVGPVNVVSWLPEQMTTKFEKYGIRYGWIGRRASLIVNEKTLKNHALYDQFLKELKELCSAEDLIRSPKRLDALQLIGMLCVALLVPFGSVLVGGKLIKDWYSNDLFVKKQQYVFGIFHLYRNHLKEFMEMDE